MNYDTDRISAAATIYYNKFNDFIYEQGTGAIEDDLPVFQFQQDNARFIGLDAEVSAQVASWEDGELSVRALLDFVDAEVSGSGNDNLPRIPPLRYGAGVEARFGLVSASVDYIRSTKQDDVADQELVTDAYNDLRAYLGVQIPFEDASVEAFLVGRNLTDDDQRAHTSFIKDFAPAPGRTIEAGLRVVF